MHTLELHVRSHSHSKKTLILAFMDTHPPPVTLCHKFKTTHQPLMCDVTLQISIRYFSVFVTTYLLCLFWHQNRVARLFLDEKSTLFLEKDHTCYFEVNCAKYQVILKPPLVTLRHKNQKTFPPPLRDVIFE